MKEQKQAIRSIDYQTRFERWATEDTPVVIKPETLVVEPFCNSDLDSLARIYQEVFNAQNQRLYQKSEAARLIWDEDPWTPLTAKAQVEEETSSPGCICLVATAFDINNETILVGFIITRPLDQATLASICGSETVSSAILEASGNFPLLLWEDAACLNLINEGGQTVRGIGTKLYATMAQMADSLSLVSIGRTSPGSFAERVLPKVGFAPTNPLIQDGKDRQRYWLIRKNEK